MANQLSYTGGSQTFNENPNAVQQPVEQPLTTTAAPMSSDQLAAYYQAVQASPQAAAMTPGGASTGLNNYYNSPGQAITNGASANQFQNSGQYQATYGMPGAMGFLNSPNFIANNGGFYNPNQGIPGSAQNFFNSPEYQALYGSQAAQQNASAIANGTYNPTTAFQADPSYQYNMDQALRQVNNSSAARGLLESGQTQRDLLSTAQGLQNNYYQNWLGQQNQLFGNYQNNLNTNLNNYQNNVSGQYQNYNNNQISGFNNYQSQLANLANLGLQNNGASQANSNAQTLAQLFSGNNMTAGTNTSNNIIGTGNNITQLLAQLGYLLGGQQLNTSAAQANNIFQGNQFQAQIDNEIMNQQAGQQQGAA